MIRWWYFGLVSLQIQFHDNFCKLCLQTGVTTVLYENPEISGATYARKLCLYHGAYQSLSPVDSTTTPNFRSLGSRKLLQPPSLKYVLVRW